MKGRNHLKTHIIIFAILFSFVAYYFVGNPSLIDAMNPSTLGIGLLVSTLLFVASSILPDSDSKDKGSLIYFTGIFILAYIHNFMESFVRLFTKRSRGHRESMHTVLGAFISTILWVLILGGIFSLIRVRMGAWYFIWFLILFLGQLLHFLEDLHFKFR